MAEVLITLGIIGVVAAITIPTLIKNYQKQVTITKLKKAYSVLSNVVAKSVSDNGTVSDFLTPGSSISAEKTEEFAKTYWLPYFKSPKIITDESFYGIDHAYSYLDNVSYRILTYTKYNIGRIVFHTYDGITYLIMVSVQNSNYSSNQQIYVDINGNQRPNIIGKDVFRFDADFERNIVLPYGINNSANSINGNCNKTCSNAACGVYCAAKIMKDNWQIRKDYPW